MGLKPSYFAEGDGDTRADTASNEDEGDDTLKDNDNLRTEDHESVAAAHDEGEDGDDDSMHIDLDMPSQPVFQTISVTRPTTSAGHAPLIIPGGFQWSASNEQLDDHAESESSSDEADGDAQSSKKKRRRKEIEHDLTADLHTKTPESNADFERLLLGSPNSSYLWIQYMSFQLQLSEVEKAKQVARRAIQTINFREEQERLNVWVALLNLENVYGTDETLESTFKDAARHNDSKTVHLRLASILDEADKHEVSSTAQVSFSARSARRPLRKLRSNINERAKSSARVPRFGPCTESIT